ncbi:MAG: DUF3006 domain-containing protein [Firmicutes bacterium HGW-Firmicutes-16]|nr:MAG: DUF3006 domain-containing protein [Firmicutes bacterium HGW-Firmicutes-16]
MNFIIEQIKEHYAIASLENRDKVNIPKQLVPPGAVEGTVLTININLDETEKQKAGISRLIKDLWKE